VFVVLQGAAVLYYGIDYPTSANYGRKKSDREEGR
jgi:hypothetical protein